MFTIEPPPARRMAGMAYFVPRKTPLAFTAITRSHSAAVRSSIAPRGMTIAALLIRMSSRPWRPVASLTAFCQSASLVTSRCTYAASPPAARMEASTFLPSASRMSPKTTFAPSRANVSASAAPCPRAPPLISATFPSSFPISVSLFGRPSARGRRVRDDPVFGDVDAPREPHALVASDVVQRALEAGRPRGMPDEPQMQPERHHLGLRLALAVEHVEAVLHEREVVVGGEQATAAELRIVGREAVRHDQVRVLVHAHPVRQLVVVGIRVVEEAALFDEEAPRVHAGPVPAIPAHRPRADGLLHGLDGHLDVLALFVFGELVVLDPPPAVRTDVEPGFADGGGHRRVPLERQRAAEDGQRQPALPEEAQDAPEAHTAAVLEQAFGGEVTALDAVVGGPGLGQRGLGEAVVVDVILGAFFVVDHEVHGDPRLARPARVGRIAAVADEVSRIGGRHGRDSRTSSRPGGHADGPRPDSLVRFSRLRAARSVDDADRRGVPRSGA